MLRTIYIITIYFYRKKEGARHIASAMYVGKKRQNLRVINAPKKKTSFATACQWAAVCSMVTT